ncbi:GGDEF domain-containing protein [Aquabacterium sp.]|uniref:GGDEF domain-containing protein n=1 Tax=Aquabacterium sp. TaxID=1872578 RepID=UPI0035B22DCC
MLPTPLAAELTEPAVQAGAPAVARGPWRLIGDAVLGTEPRQRVWLRRTLLSGLMYLLFNLLRWAGAVHGLVPWRSAQVVAAYEITGFLALYAVLRSGRTRHLRDPALTLLQILLGLSALVLNYAFVEASRNVALPLLSLVLVFGMYRLTPGQILLAGGATVVMLLAMLLVMWRVHEPGFDVAEQSLNVVLAAVTLPMFAMVARRLAQMRQRNVRQKADMAEAIEQLHHLATRDGLTGLVNRRHMMAQLADEQLRLARSQRACCVALLDIDHFKRVNDTHGHQMGDSVLIGFARQVVEVLPGPDAVCRWGGEEFLVLMPEMAQAEARAAIERLLRRIDIALPAHADGSPWRVTLSAGLAEVRAGETLQRAIERADAALYRAKQAGRDRLELAT